MQTKTIDDQLAKIMTFLLMLVVGPSYLIGGWNVGISYILIAISIYLAFKGEGRNMNFAAKYFAVLSVIYYVYFGSRVLMTGIDERALRFFQENIIFLGLPLLLMLGYKLDTNWIIKRSADLLFPAAVLLLVFTFIEKEYFIKIAIPRVELNARSPLILGVLIVSGIHFSLVDWHQRRWAWRLGAIAAWLIGLFVILAWNQSRAALVMHFAGLGVFLVFLICSVRYSWRRNLIALLGLAAFYIAMVSAALLLIMNSNMFLRFNEPIQALFAGDISKLDTSSIWRIEMWSLALDRIKDSPIFGFGPQNTFAVIADEWKNPLYLGHLHNDFLNHLVGGGLIGVTLYVALLLVPLVAIIFARNIDDQKIYVCFLAFLLVFLAGLSARVFFRPVMIEWVALTYYFCILCSKGDTSGFSVKKS